jgi:hypothetical protein
MSSFDFKFQSRRYTAAHSAFNVGVLIEAVLLASH